MNPEFEAEWPGASSLATECVLNLFVVQALIETRSRAWLQEAGLPSLAAFNVLTILHGAGEPLLPSVISERLIVTRGTMTGILDSLEKRMLVRRTPHPSDGRMRQVEITAQAAKLVVAFRRRIHRAERRLVSSLSRKEQEALLDALARLQAAAHGLSLIK